MSALSASRSPREVDALFFDEPEMAVAEAEQPAPAPEPAEDDSSSEVRSNVLR